MPELAREDWLAERRLGLGGSDIAAVCGLSPWRTPYDVYADKLGLAPEQDDNDAMYWGRVLEDVIAEEYARRSGHKVRRVHRILRHPKHAWMAANLDRAIVTNDRGRGVLECKTAGAFKLADWGDEGTDEVPVYYRTQVQWYLAITGYDYGDLAVLIGGRDFRVYTLPRDDELIDDLVRIGERFWREHVAAGVPPDAVNAADLAAMFPADDGSTVIASPEIATAVARINEIRREEKELKAQRDRLEFDVKQWLAESSTLTDATGSPLATWKTQTSRRVDTKKLRAEFPDVANRVEKTTTTRVLRVKEPK